MGSPVAKESRPRGGDHVQYKAMGSTWPCAFTRPRRKRSPESGALPNLGGNSRLLESRRLLTAHCDVAGALQNVRLHGSPIFSTAGFATESSPKRTCGEDFPAPAVSQRHSPGRTAMLPDDPENELRSAPYPRRTLTSIRGQPPSLPCWSAHGQRVGQSRSFVPVSARVIQTLIRIRTCDFPP